MAALFPLCRAHDLRLLARRPRFEPSPTAACPKRQRWIPPTSRERVGWAVTAARTSTTERRSAGPPAPSAPDRLDPAELVGAVGRRRSTAKRARHRRRRRPLVPAATPARSPAVRHLRSRAGLPVQGTCPAYARTVDNTPRPCGWRWRWPGSATPHRMGGGRLIDPLSQAPSPAGIREPAQGRALRGRGRRLRRGAARRPRRGGRGTTVRHLDVLAASSSRCSAWAALNIVPVPPRALAGLAVASGSVRPSITSPCTDSGHVGEERLSVNSKLRWDSDFHWSTTVEHWVEVCVRTTG